MGIEERVLKRELDQLARSFEAATDNRSGIAKERLSVLLEALGRDIEDVCRRVARFEADDESGTLIEFRDKLEDALREWRSRA